MSTVSRRRVIAGIGAAGIAGVLPAPVWAQAQAIDQKRYKAEQQNGETVTRASSIDDLVTANHIVAHEGVLDAFGHVSIRDPADPNRFIISRALAPELITADDLIVYDLDGRALENQRGRQQYSERFIHAEIYKRRADVNAVVHSHSPTIIPYADTGVPLKPMLHMTAFLYQGVPTFEIRDVAGDGTNLLINNAKLGQAVAEKLGNGAVVLMRGHGMVVVGSEIRDAVYRAVFTETNARIESQTLQLSGGKPINFLSNAEGATIQRVQAGEATNRAWFMWKARVTGK